MSETNEYVPPKVWTWNKPNGGRFANINRPIAGPTHEKELPVGRHPLQLYSLATPNGVKVTIMLEELLALGHAGAEYDAWLINIGEGDQFGSGFVAINPNSKIPAHGGPQRAEADPGLRVRRDPAVSGGEVRRVPADASRARAPNACRGCSGRWAARLISAAASAISTPMRRRRSNTPSTGSPWRRSACSTCSIGGSARAEYLAGDALHHRRHRRVPLVRRPRRRRALRRRRVPVGAGLQERAALGRRRSLPAPGGASAGAWSTAPGAIPPSQLARAPRRQRFRDQDAGQARGGGGDLGFSDPPHEEVGVALTGSLPMTALEGSAPSRKW